MVHIKNNSCISTELIYIQISTYAIFKKFFLNLFLAVLGLWCCTWAFSSCGAQVQFFHGIWNLPGVCACVCCFFSRVQFCVTPWTVACQAHLFMGFSRHEYWSEFPCPPPEDLPDPGIKPASLMSPALAGRFFTTSATLETPISMCSYNQICQQDYISIF